MNKLLTRTHSLRTWRIILALLSCTALPLHAASQDLETLRQLAERHALETAVMLGPRGASMTASTARLDPRLRLPDCGAALTAFTPQGQGAGFQLSVGIRCAGEPGWSVYVPVRLEARAPVVVLVAPATRGTALAASQLRLEERDLARASGGYLLRLEDAAGMVLRRPAMPGTVLSQNMLEPPRLVRRGQRVRLLAGTDKFSIQSDAEALADGAQGERIRVRNLKSRRVVEAVVAEAGVVRVSP